MEPFIEDFAMGYGSNCATTLEQPLLLYLNARLDSQETRINDLDARLKRLDSELKRLKQDMPEKQTMPKQTESVSDLIDYLRTNIEPKLASLENKIIGVSR